MASVRALQERLTSSLTAVGYEGEVGTLPISVENNQKLVNFLEWTVGQVKPENHLTPEQARRYAWRIAFRIM